MITTTASHIRNAIPDDAPCAAGALSPAAGAVSASGSTAARYAHTVRRPCWASWQWRCCLRRRCWGRTKQPPYGSAVPCAGVDAGRAAGQEQQLSLSVAAAMRAAARPEE